MKALQKFLDWGGTRKDVALLVLSAFPCFSASSIRCPCPLTPPGWPLCCAASPLF